MVTKKELMDKGFCSGYCDSCSSGSMGDGSCSIIRGEEIGTGKIYVIVETYTITAVIEHELNRDEYREYRKMSKDEKKDFLDSGRFQSTPEETYPNGNSKFKLKKD